MLVKALEINRVRTEVRTRLPISNVSGFVCWSHFSEAKTAHIMLTPSRGTGGGGRGHAQGLQPW